MGATRATLHKAQDSSSCTAAPFFFTIRIAQRLPLIDLVGPTRRSATIGHPILRWLCYHGEKSVEKKTTKLSNVAADNWCVLKPKSSVGPGDGLQLPTTGSFAHERATWRLYITDISLFPYLTNNENEGNPCPCSARTLRRSAGAAEFGHNCDTFCGSLWESRGPGPDI